MVLPISPLFLTSGYQLLVGVADEATHSGFDLPLVLSLDFMAAGQERPEDGRHACLLPVTVLGEVFAAITAAALGVHLLALRADPFVVGPRLLNLLQLPLAAGHERTVNELWQL
jgi:hypothetical protein